MIKELDFSQPTENCRCITTALSAGTLARLFVMQQMIDHRNKKIDEAKFHC